MRKVGGKSKKIFFYIGLPKMHGQIRIGISKMHGCIHIGLPIGPYWSDWSVLVSLKCMDGSVLAHLRLSIQSVPSRFPQLGNPGVP